jgi:hypothetical protein
MIITSVLTNLIAIASYTSKNQIEYLRQESPIFDHRGQKLDFLVVRLNLSLKNCPSSSNENAPSYADLCTICTNRHTRANFHWVSRAITLKYHNFNLKPKLDSFIINHAPTYSKCLDLETLSN